MPFLILIYFLDISLTLVSVTSKGNFILDVPKSEVLFPCLKKLELLSVYYSGDQLVVNLISGSLVLEELFVERQVFCDGLYMFKVSSHSLKRLRMLSINNVSRRMMGGISACVYMIDVPNLEYLKVEDKMSAISSFTNMPSLVEAHMDTTGTDAKLLKCLSSAKTLTLTSSTIRVVLFVHGIGMCRFPNLVKLVIDISRDMHWDLLLLFLLNMPNLEHITFLNEMIILNLEALALEDFPLISYLLKHSSVLERFTVNAHNIDPKRREQLLNFQCGSHLCQIKFV